MFEGNPIVKPALTVAARIIGEQAYVLDPGEGKLERLNAVGTYVWGLIAEGDRHFDDLHAAVIDTFEVDADTARKDLIDFLETLRGKRMIDLID